MFVISHVYYSIASLYNWRYRKLGSLPHVWTYPEYQLANAGFEFDYQLINVENFNGVGESEPNPYFFQVRNNSGEWCHGSMCNKPCLYRC